MKVQEGHGILMGGKGESYFPSSNPVFTISFNKCTHFEGLKFLAEVISVAAGI